MRHLGSVALAMLMAPVILALTGRGIGSFLDATTHRQPDPLAAAAALAALGLAGMLFALLIMPRFSPLGPLLAAAGYLTIGTLALVEPDLMASAQPWTVLELDQSAVVLTGAVALLLAMPLLLSIFSAQRWTGHTNSAATATQPAGSYPPPGYGQPPHPPYTQPAYAPPAYTQPSYAQPGYASSPYPPSYAPGGGYPRPERPTPTLVMPAVGDPDPQTQRIEPLRSTGDEQPTQVSAAVPGEPTVTSPPPRPTGALASEEPTEAMPTEAMPTEAVPTEAHSSEQPTEALPPGKPTEAMPSEEPTGAHSTEEGTVAAADGPDSPTDSADSADMATATGGQAPGEVDTDQADDVSDADPVTDADHVIADDATDPSDELVSNGTDSHEPDGDEPDSDEPPVAAATEKSEPATSAGKT